MPLLEVKNLHTFFRTKKGIVKAVNDVSYSLDAGKTIGIVGESGSGKSVTAMSILQLLDGNGFIDSGEVLMEGHGDLTKLSIKEMYNIRGNDISVIFQEPMTSLNPVFTVDRQLSEPFRIHQGMKKKQAHEEAVKMLEAVQIPNPEVVIKQYPHQLSGGMRQRVMIAMALACNPKIIIADEPTTALDVTIQAQILDLLRGLKDKINSSIMLITHDLGVIAEMADYVVVMYAGRVVEKGTAEDIFYHPAHPYTIGLMASKPVVGREVDELYSIPGKVPNPINMPNYCYFRDRCEMRLPCCDGEYPCEISISDTHKVSCYRFYEAYKDLVDQSVENPLLRQMQETAAGGAKGGEN